MKVLIVCHGNINRSAAGEIILKTMLPGGWEVRSAGLKAMDGRITAKKMREALAELGYTQTSVRSTAMDNNLANWADSIMYMDDSNHDRLLTQYPDHRDKFCRLASLIGEHKIPDPNYSKTNDMHKKVIDMLERSLEAFIKEQIVDNE